MARFCELGVEADVVIGKGIDMEELFNRRILIEKTIIQPTKYPGKNASGLRMQMQVVLATFNPTPDKSGDYYQKDESGVAIGERRSCFHRVGHPYFRNTESGKQDARIEQGTAGARRTLVECLSNRHNNCQGRKVLSIYLNTNGNDGIYPGYH